EVDPGGRTIMRTLSAQKYGFDLPTILTSGGGDLWVLNSADNSVTELTTSDGSFVRRLSAARYGFSTAGKLAASGGHLWVSDPAANAVTEINASNGAILRRLTAARYGFSSPTALNFADGHLWVADRDNSSVTEVNPANGTLVRRIEGLPSPAVLASSGDRLWVLCGNNQKRFGLAVEVNASSGAVVRRVDGARLDLGTAFSAAFAGGRLWFSDNNSTVEVNPSTGTFVRKIPIFVISDEIDTPGALTSDGRHLWMAAAFGLSEFPADGPDDTGPGILGCVATQSRALTIPAAGASCGHGSAEIGWLRNGPGGQPGAAGWPGVITGASYGFGAPNSVTAAGGRIWVTNASGNSVTEINAANGAVVRVISGAKYQLRQPIALTYDNGAIWVVNAAGNSLTEISAADGSLVRVVSAAADHFSQPIAVAGDGTDLWVANSTGNSVTELSASDGTLVRWLSTGYSFGFP